MDSAGIILIVLKISIGLTVVSLGLDSDFKDVLSLSHRPALLLRSLCAMDLIMPLVAVALASAFNLPPVAKITLIALSISPVPPVLPKRQIKAGGNSDYAIGLLVIAGLVSILYIPLAFEFVIRLFSVPFDLAPSQVIKIVLITVFIPLGSGLAVRHFLQSFAERIAVPLAKIANSLLLAAAVPIILKMWPAMVSLIGSGAPAAFALFVVIGLLVGHVLGGPSSEDRRVLALSTAARHPGVALVIAGASFQEKSLLLSAILLYMVLGLILSIPYLQWQRIRPVSKSETGERRNIPV